MFSCGKTIKVAFCQACKLVFSCGKTIKVVLVWPANSCFPVLKNKKAVSQKMFLAVAEHVRCAGKQHILYRKKVVFGSG